MPITEKLYYKNAYQQEFDAQIIDSFEKNGWVYVGLSATLFYPGGGGQPKDRGWIQDQPVLDVYEQNGIIYHALKAFPDKEPVQGRIDFDWRWDAMQQHTGQHILSAAFLQIASLPTVSVHFGEETTAIELDASAIPESVIQDVESLANRIVGQNRKVEARWVSHEAVDQLPLRRKPPRMDRLRVVEIENFDMTPCGGTHVRTTGEVGWIKYTGSEKIRGRWRLHWKIGQRAVRDYQQKIELVKHLSNLLTCAEETLPLQVQRLKEQIKRTTRQMRQLQKDLLTLTLENIERQGMPLGEYRILATVVDWDREFTKALAEQLIQQPDLIVLLICASDERLYWFAGSGENVSVDIWPILSPCLPLIEGKGGGRDRFYQGGGRRTPALSDFLNQFVQRLKEELAHA
ncbi:MAG: hypothetical protein GXO78_12140 [Calditrichaeota bacterium]|nr:hypothetical protein [Calditrichota bacterium]